MDHNKICFLKNEKHEKENEEWKGKESQYM